MNQYVSMSSNILYAKPYATTQGSQEYFSTIKIVPFATNSYLQCTSSASQLGQAVWIPSSWTLFEISSASQSASSIMAPHCFDSVVSPGPNIISKRK